MKIRLALRLRPAPAPRRTRWPRTPCRRTSLGTRPPSDQKLNWPKLLPTAGVNSEFSRLLRSRRKSLVASDFSGPRPYCPVCPKADKAGRFVDGRGKIVKEAKVASA